jgi:hypothetical protein
MLKILSNISANIITEYEKYKAKLAFDRARDNSLLNDEAYKLYGSYYANNWMVSHKNDYLSGKYQGYISEPSNYTYGYDYCIIYFYENSSVDGNQKKFSSRKEFFKFCEECNIVIDNDMHDAIKNSYQSYITCFPGKNELMLSTSFNGLKESLKRYEKIAHSLSLIR